MRSALAEAQEAGREDLCNLGQALRRGHQIGRQGIGAGKAAIEIAGAGTGVRAHLPLVAIRTL